MKKSATIIPCRKKDCPSKPASEKKWCLIDSNDVAKRCAPTKEQCKEHEKNVNYFKHKKGSGTTMNKQAAEQDPFAAVVAGSLKKLNIDDQLATVANYLAHWKDAPKLETPEGQKAFAAFLKAVPALAILQKWRQGLQKQLGAAPKSASLRTATKAKTWFGIARNVAKSLEGKSSTTTKGRLWEEAKHLAYQHLDGVGLDSLVSNIEGILENMNWGRVLLLLENYDEDFFQGGVVGVIEGIIADAIADEVIRILLPADSPPSLLAHL